MQNCDVKLSLLRVKALLVVLTVFGALLQRAETSFVFKGLNPITQNGAGGLGLRK